MIRLYDVHKKDDGLYYVVREDGKVICKRHRPQHAEEIASLLDFKKSYLTERAQVIRDMSDAKIEVREKAKLPYRVVDRYGVLLIAFKYKYLADWWLKDYRAKKEARKIKQENAESSMT